MHPAHVPLVGETQAALLGRLADPRPGGGLFGDDQRTRGLVGSDAVKVADEVDGFQVLAPAVTVGYPFASLARVVAVQHRGHRIDAQAVDVEMLQPVQRRSHHEAAHFIAPEVVDQRVPVLVVALQGVVVFVQRSAIEARQAMFVGGKMRRHPVQQHTNASLVAGVDERGEILGTAIARGGREHRQWLIAPGAAERVFHDRQQFDVGKAQFLHIGHQPFGQFAPVVETPDFARFVQLAAP
ncbi:hypothetical protein D9M71_494660 [compost metagenome]